MKKEEITIQLDKEVKAALEKRAKRELMSLSDMISDILRRSAVSYKGNSSLSDKLDDKFVGYFSRKKRK